MKLRAGISELVVKLPRYYVDCAELAQHRGIPVEKIIQGLGCEQFGVPYSQSIVDLAVEALSELDLSGVDRFYVATESHGDLAKPLGVMILSRLGKHHAELRELKFACLSGWQAVQDACEYSILANRPAIVICVDRCIYRAGGSEEFTQGCGAVAIKIEREPALVEIDHRNVGCYLEDLDDFKVPAHQFPYPELPQEYRGQLSLISYLTALRNAYEDWKRKNRELMDQLEQANQDLLDFMDRFVFHIPFPKMGIYGFAELYKHEKLKAGYLSIQDYLRNPELWEKYRSQLKQIIQLPEFNELLSRKLAPGLRYNSLIGNCYTASAFISLASTLESASPGMNIGIGGYGSGMGAIAIRGIALGTKYDSQIQPQLRSRQKLEIQEYEAWRKLVARMG